MLVTLLGIVTDDNMVQEENAPSPMLTTPSGRTIIINIEQSKNALFPIDVTLSGIDRAGKDEHISKAELPIVLNPSGSTTCPIIDERPVHGACSKPP